MSDSSFSYCLYLLFAWGFNLCPFLSHDVLCYFSLPRLSAADFILSLNDRDRGGEEGKREREGVG